MLLRGLGASMIDNSGLSSFILSFWRYEFTQCQKELLGARWLETNGFESGCYCYSRDRMFQFSIVDFHDQ